MNIKRYLQARKYLLLFLMVLLLIGFGIGMFLGITNIEALRYSVISYASNMGGSSFNYLYFHFFMVIISVLLSFCLIGVPLLCTIIFYEGMSSGFLLGIFSLTYGLKGLLFSVIFLLITKFIYIFLLIFLFSKCLQIARRMIGRFLYKSNNNELLFHLVKGVLVIVIGIIFYDTLLMFTGTKIIQNFSFLLT